jgi:ATP-binding cassette subfamily F protein 1
VKINPRLRIGRYNQHFVDVLTYDESAVEYLMRMSPGLVYQDARNLLGKFGLEGNIMFLE